jgi:uncharacterized coiled-coil DUF342 family protein
MEAMRESWTDARMNDLNGKVDELSRRVDNGFNRAAVDLRDLRKETTAEVGALRSDMNDCFDKLDARFGNIDGRFEKIDERFESLHRLMVQFCGLAIAASIGLIATQV